MDEGLSLDNLAFVMLSNSVNYFLTSFHPLHPAIGHLFYLNYSASASGLIRMVVSTAQLIAPAVFSSTGART